RRFSRVMRVSSSGGTPVPATELDKGGSEVTNRFAQLLPGGDAFLFTASRNNNVWEDATIQVQNHQDPETKNAANRRLLRTLHRGAAADRKPRRRALKRRLPVNCCGRKRKEPP